MIRKSRKRRRQQKKKKILGGKEDIEKLNINLYLKDDGEIDLMLMNHGIDKLIRDYTPDVESFKLFFKEAMEKATDYVCQKILKDYDCECNEDLKNKIGKDLEGRLETLYYKFEEKKK